MAIPPSDVLAVVVLLYSMAFYLPRSGVVGMLLFFVGPSAVAR